MDDEHTEFDAWAAELYSRDLTTWETVQAISFGLFILCLIPLAPFAWLYRKIKEDL